TMIFLPSFPQIMQQDCQMQEILSLHLLAYLPDDRGLFGNGFGLRHRQNSMLINRIFMILVELHQATERREYRNDLFQKMGAMHRLKRAGDRTWTCQDLEKHTADFR